MKTGEGKQATRRAPNRLINETSTYLQQHAYNPVDWYPWGAEAIEKAKREDKPILLSIGYAACHWCHVMERESFEDEETARLMNDNFVSIKVDREERTDLDEIYMKAVQMLTGHGGWPMTVFLTQDLKPFYGGTYFPPEDRHGLPSFKRLLAGIMEAWQTRRGDVAESSEEITAQLKELDNIGVKVRDAGTKETLSKDVLLACARRLLQSFDHRYGGFGGAPKFPHTFSIQLAMRCLSHLSGSESEKESFRELVTTTLDQMAYGGINDHLGGGFARYSVDRQWLVPHFEKMLYDNALLCQTYLDGYALLGRSYWADVARGIMDFVARELRTEDGAFYSSLDADSEGEEGKFYVWKPEQLDAVLGKDDAQWFSTVMGVSEYGNFEHGTSVLHLTASPETLAEKHGMSVDELWSRLEPLREKLLKAREKRVRPGRDEKVLTSWNSLMISACVDGYRVLGEEKYLNLAREAARFLLNNLFQEGRLLRTWGQGKAQLNAYLDDYAYFANALLDLASVDMDPVWFEHAQILTNAMLRHFWDESENSLFYTSDDHETLVTRPRSHYDGSIPSGTSMAVFLLIRMARLKGKEDYEKKAEALINMYAPFFTRMPDQFSNLVCAADFFLSPHLEIAVIADPKDKNWTEYVFAIYSRYLPNKVVLSSRPDRPLETPVTDDRKLVEDKPTVYICQNFTCEKPIAKLDQLKEKILQLSAVG